MKFVFALVVVALCVLYMHAPVMEARPNAPLRKLHKRSAEDHGNQDNGIPGGSPKGHREHGIKVNKNQESKPPGEEVEEEGEERIGSGENPDATDHKKVNKNQESNPPGEEEEEEGEERIGSGEGHREHGKKVKQNQESNPPGEEVEEEGEERIGSGENPDATDRKKRAATDKQKIHTWPSTSICYKFQPAWIGSGHKKTIKGKEYSLSQLMENAANEWNDKSGFNIHFDQNGANCIEVKDGSGCWSWIGFQGVGKNEIVLQYPSCLTHGVILHEMGHALGLIHEAKRGDRAQYISVVDANVQTDAEAEFKIDNDAVGIQSSYEHSSEYDYCSIMHYSPKAFSANSKNTITVNNAEGNAEDLIPCMGSQLGLSIRDGEGAAAIYGTLQEDQTKVAAAGCKYGSYLLKSDNNKCRCSNLFEGNTCEKPKIKPADAQCGNTMINLGNDDVQTFKSPNFGSDKYPFDTTCSWVVTAPADKQLCIAFPDGYNVEMPAKSGDCAFDWFEIVLDELLTLKTRRYCGKDPGWYSAFNTNFAAIVFTSDEAYNEQGFEGVVTAIDRGVSDADAACKTKITNAKGNMGGATTYEQYYDYLANQPGDTHANNDYYYYYYY